MLSFYKLKNEDAEKMRQQLEVSFNITQNAIEKFLGNTDSLNSNSSKTIFLFQTKVDSSFPPTLSWKIHKDLPSTDQYCICGILVMANVATSIFIERDEIQSLEIKTLHISSKWRGRGYDSILLEKAFYLAKENGVVEHLHLSIPHIKKSNPTPTLLHNFGFKRIPKCENSDDTLFYKDLQNDLSRLSPTSTSIHERQRSAFTPFSIRKRMNETTSNTLSPINKRFRANYENISSLYGYQKNKIVNLPLKTCRNLFPTETEGDEINNIRQNHLQQYLQQQKQQEQDQQTTEYSLGRKNAVMFSCGEKLKIKDSSIGGNIIELKQLRLKPKPKYLFHETMLQSNHYPRTMTKEYLDSMMTSTLLTCHKLPVSKFSFDAIMSGQMKFDARSSRDYPELDKMKENEFILYSTPKSAPEKKSSYLESTNLELIDEIPVSGVNDTASTSSYTCLVLIKKVSHYQSIENIIIDYGAKNILHNYPKYSSETDSNNNDSEGDGHLGIQSGSIRLNEAIKQFHNQYRSNYKCSKGNEMATSEITPLFQDMKVFEIEVYHHNELNEN